MSIEIETVMKGNGKLIGFQISLKILHVKVRCSEKRVLIVQYYFKLHAVGSFFYTLGITIFYMKDPLNICPAYST